MLDISIPKIVKAVTSNAAAKEFCNQYVRVEEKLDGTKLTLIRNNDDFDPDNYLKNWIVSYKENVVFPEEFSGLAGRGREEEIEKKSAGRSQYSFVHDHLRRVHPQTKDIPPGYEFFVEFIQRKPTISRSYEKTGGLYLTGFGPTTYSLRGGRVTSLADFENDSEKKSLFGQLLELSEYPVLFEGRFDSSDSIIEGCKDPKIRQRFESEKQKIDDLIFADDWKGVLGTVVNIFSDFTSSLGGDAEGVVISPVADPETGQTTKFTGKLYKTSRADQHDQEMRRVKKQAEFGEKSAEEEEIYYGNLSRFVRNKIDEDDLDDEPLELAISILSDLVYNMSRQDFFDVGVENENKNLINMQEDAIAAVRNILGKRRAAGGRKGKDITRVGVVPMAVKPLHKGHWEVINRAARENDKVFLIVSAKSRESGGVEISGSDMIKIWKRYLEPILPSNVDISYSAEPVGDTRGAIRSYAKDEDVYFRLYAGEDDADRFSSESLQKYYPVQYDAGRIEPVLVKNVAKPDGQRISGTHMRDLLARGEREEFEFLLPEDLSDADKESIWKILYKDKSLTESSIRLFVRSCILS